MRAQLFFLTRSREDAKIGKRVDSPAFPVRT